MCSGSSWKVSLAGLVIVGVRRFGTGTQGEYNYISHARLVSAPLSILPSVQFPKATKPASSPAATFDQHSQTQWIQAADRMESSHRGVLALNQMSCSNEFPALIV